MQELLIQDIDNDKKLKKNTCKKIFQYGKYIIGLGWLIFTNIMMIHLRQEFVSTQEQVASQEILINKQSELLKNQSKIINELDIKIQQDTFILFSLITTQQLLEERIIVAENILTRLNITRNEIFHLEYLMNIALQFYQYNLTYSMKNILQLNQGIDKKFEQLILFNTSTYDWLQLQLFTFQHQLNNNFLLSISCPIIIQPGTYINVRQTFVCHCSSSSLLLFGIWNDNLLITNPYWNYKLLSSFNIDTQSWQIILSYSGTVEVQQTVGSIKLLCQNKIF